MDLKGIFLYTAELMLLDPVDAANRSGAAPSRNCRHIHCKKRLASFPPSGGMSLTKLSLNYSRPERVWLVTSRLGTGNSLTFFYSVLYTVLFALFIVQSVTIQSLRMLLLIADIHQIRLDRPESGIVGPALLSIRTEDCAKNFNLHLFSLFLTVVLMLHASCERCHMQAMTSVPCNDDRSALHATYDR
jgi:hypothetical protein